MSTALELKPNGEFTCAKALLADQDQFPADGSVGRAEEIAAGASGRRFFRIRRGGRTRILMHYPAEPEENLLFTGVGRVLRRADIPVPEILASEPERQLVWLEDLGDRDLFSMRSAPGQRKAAYRQAVEVVVRIQTMPESVFHEERARTLPPFDEDLYGFEQRYFAAELLQRLLPRREASAALLREWDGIRAALLAGTPTWVHRDFQSKNLMLDERDRIRVVDFQGIRRGHRFYDLASLLCDPYVRLPSPEREMLLAFYETRSADPGGGDPVLFATACCQRVMQALGAYGKFGLGAGVPFFLDQIGPALRLLGESALRANLPSLASLATDLGEAFRAFARTPES